MKKKQYLCTQIRVNMKELKCPHCGNVFTVDESDYAALLNQVKNSEFETELSRRVHELEQNQQAKMAAQLQTEKVQNQLQQQQLQAQVQQLQSQIQQAEQQKELAVAQVRQKATESYMKKEQELTEAKTKWAEQLKAAQEQVQYYKDLKMKMSTKMVGETLEIHCSTLFRSMQGSREKNLHI